MSEEFRLPGRVANYLTRLAAEYERASESLLHRVVSEATCQVVECENGGWGGRRWGHAVELTVPQAIHAEVPLDALGESCERLKNDLNRLLQVPFEYVCRVSLEPGDAATGTGAPAEGAAPPVGPDEGARRVWGEGEGLRVFLSHRAEYKEFAHQVKEGLLKLGMRSFVAHDDIAPSAEWMEEIKRALRSMDTFVSLITDGFHESPWVDQEAGYALARDVPIVAVKLAGADPGGFLGRWQALTSNPEEKEAAAELAKGLLDVWRTGADTRDKALLGLAHALLASGSYAESKSLVGELKRSAPLPPAVAQVVRQALESNRQVYEAYGAVEGLKQLLSADDLGSEERSE